MSELKRYTILGRPALLHPECRESFLEDRRCGLIYGPYIKADGLYWQCAEDMSIGWEICPYCSRGSESEGEPADLADEDTYGRGSPAAPYYGPD